MPRQRQRQSCYMCNKPATGKEHVPPECFFPEVKDIGIDYKKNLITVHSCDEHNLKKSLDDQYLLGVVAFHWRNNELAYKQSVTKIKRALRYRKKYFDLFFKPGQHDLLYWNKQKLVTGPIDIQRIDLCFDKIARGIYYHHFRAKWLESVDIQHFSLVAVYRQHHPVIDALNQTTLIMRELCADKLKNGANPEVFFYQIAQDDPPSDTLMRLVFYGGFEVMAIFSRTSRKA